MKRVRHILRKDLVRLKWILLLWGIVLAGAHVLVGVQARLDAETYGIFLALAKVIILGVVPLIQVGLLMSLVHDDSVVAVDVFWLTRPISGRELLTAKILGWLAIGILPVAVSMPLWIAHDLDWAQLGVATQQTLRTHLLIGIGALPFAMMSGSSSKFVMSLIVAGGGMLLFSLLLQLGGESEDAPTPALLIQSRAWLVSWIWIVASVVVALNQYLRRRTQVSIALLTVAAIAGFLVVGWWPWKLPMSGDELTSSPSMMERAANPVSFHGVESTNPRDEPRYLVEVPLHDGAVAVRNGVAVYVQTAAVDWTGKLEVSFCESTPTSFDRFAELMPGAVERPSRPARYLVRNRISGTAFPVVPAQLANSINAATLRFTRLSFTTRPASELADRGVDDLTAWMKDAELVRLADDERAPRNRPTEKPSKS